MVTVTHNELCNYDVPLSVLLTVVTNNYLLSRGYVYQAQQSGLSPLYAAEAGADKTHLPVFCFEDSAAIKAPNSGLSDC